MSIRGKAHIAGIYEHPRREIPDRTLSQLHAEVGLGALAAEVASGAPLALRAVNRTLRAGLGDRVREATAHEASEQARLGRTDDAREGMRAVAERRPGTFTGR